MTSTFELPAELTIYGATETGGALLAWAAEQTTQSQRRLNVSALQVK